MAEVTQQLMYEVLRNLQQRFDRVDLAISELRKDMVSLRNQVHTAQGDINSLRASFVRVNEGLDPRERGQPPLDPL